MSKLFTEDTFRSLNLVLSVFGSDAVLTTRLVTHWNPKDGLINKAEDIIYVYDLYKIS